MTKLNFTPTLEGPEQPTKKEGKARKCQLSCFHSSKVKGGSSKKKRPATKLSARLKQASSQGFQIMKNILFPSIPAVFQDLWVYIEISIAIAAFVVGALDTFESESQSVYTYVYFFLAIVSFLFVLTDGYLYFIELGSCARGYRVVKKWMDERRQNEVDSSVEDETNENGKKCCKLSPKWKQNIKTWFEVIRNTITELLLYPLLIFDLLSFIVERGYEPSDTMQRIDFSLFLMESFYLILSVYIMRMVLVITSMISLLKLPTDKNDDTTKPILVRFSIHMLSQMIVHLLIVLVVAAKINNENQFIDNSSSNATSDIDDDDDINASYFLIASILSGGIVPLAGSAMFFVVNYYWMRQFSISFWVNMISLLQGESFAEAVFGGEGVSSKEKARDFVQQSQFSKVKKELKKYKSPSLLTKLLFPAKFPGLLVIGFLYYAILLTFIVSLTLTDSDEDPTSINLAIFREDHLLSTMFVITSLCLTIANVQILLVFSTVIVVFGFVLIASIVLIVASVFLSVVVVFPVLGGVGFSLLLVDISSSLFARRYCRKNSTESISTELFTQYTSEPINLFEEHNYQLVTETKI